MTEDTLGYRIEDRFSNFSASKQAALQIAGCGVSLGFAIITGMMTGILLKLPCFNAPNLLFDDEAFWVIEAKPEDDLGIGHARKRTEDTELNRHNAR